MSKKKEANPKPNPKHKEDFLKVLGAAVQPTSEDFNKPMFSKVASVRLNTGAGILVLITEEKKVVSTYYILKAMPHEFKIEKLINGKIAISLIIDDIVTTAEGNVDYDFTHLKYVTFGFIDQFGKLQWYEPLESWLNIRL